MRPSCPFRNGQNDDALVYETFKCVSNKEQSPQPSAMFGVLLSQINRPAKHLKNSG
jgi:hypothetical protein